MARTIGKRNIRRVKEEVKRVFWESNNNPDFTTLRDVVRDRLPVEMWGTWEMADQEIDRIINDTMWEARVGK